MIQAFESCCQVGTRGGPAKRTIDLLRLIGALKEQSQTEGQIPPTTTAAGKPNSPLKITLFPFRKVIDSSHHKTRLQTPRGRATMQRRPRTSPKFRHFPA